MVRRAECYAGTPQTKLAIRAFRDLTKVDDDPTWWYRIGRLHIRQEDEAAARKAFAQALERDPKAKKLDRKLLSASPVELEARQAMARFIRRRLDRVRADDAATGTGSAPPRRLFVYWAQGWDEAPAVARFCAEQVRRLHDPSELVFLDESALGNWVDIPAALRRTLADRPAHLSDVVRLELLSRHGGVWLDATAYPMCNVFDAIADVSAGGLFAFKWYAGRPSNWLIAASPGNYVIETMRRGLHVFWSENSKPYHYFTFHHMFEALYLLDKRFRDMWDAVPTRSSDPPHDFQLVMEEPHDPDRFRALLDGCFVHKLTYKVAPEVAEGETLLGALLRQS